MGNYLGRLTGRSPAYAAVLIVVLAKQAARVASRGKPTAQARSNLLLWIFRLVDGKGFVSQAVGDVLGLVLAWRLIKWVSGIREFARLPTAQKKDVVGNAVFGALRHLPPVQAKLAAERQKMEEGLRKSLKQSDHIQEVVSTLPAEGRSSQSLLTEMESMVSVEDPKWRDGFVSGTVYHGEQEHLDCLSRVYALFALSNPLHPDVWPSVRKFEAEIISMTASFLNGGCESVCGCITSGGTESILMAVKAHREWGLREKGITEPELIIPATAHAAFDKACEALRIKLVKLPVDQKTFLVDPRLVESRINGNTVLIVGSAPNYPQGTIDPIAELSKVARRNGVGLHVDCCLGGFVLPFAKELGYDIPTFDFSLPGVTSMSCDTHKYGFATKGTSVVLFRDKALREHMYWCYADWTGGLYCTPTMAGSRSGAVSAACWASMMRMGRNGYLEATRRIIETRKLIQQGIEAIPELRVQGSPQAMVVAWASDAVNVYELADLMSKKGWSINSLQKPAASHICVTYPHTQAGVAQRFLDDMREATATLRENSNGKPSGADEGSAPIYGMTAALPKGPVNTMLGSYMDVVLEV